MSKHPFFTAYREEPPVYKSRPWAYTAPTYPGSELWDKGFKCAVMGSYATKRQCQQEADRHRRIDAMMGASHE